VFRDDAGDFEIGSGRVRVGSEDFAFAGAVIDDLGRVAHDANGETVLRQGDALGRPVRIVKAEPPTVPPNGWTLPDDIAAATAEGVAVGQGGEAGTGIGCGSTVVYDPADWPRQGDPASPSSEAILLMLLRQANLNAAGKSNPALPDWGDKG
jgi:hypothetical protein